MIFLIRNAQNRESEAVQLKLDKLIRATKSAHNSLLDIEENCPRKNSTASKRALSGWRAPRGLNRSARHL